MEGRWTGEHRGGGQHTARWVDEKGWSSARRHGHGNVGVGRSAGHVEGAPAMVRWPGGVLTHRSGRRWPWFTAPVEINAETTTELGGCNMLRCEVCGC